MQAEHAQELTALAPAAPTTENDPVLQRTLCTITAAAVLCLAVAAPAQYGDRDRSGAPATSTHAPPPESRIDINHATVDQLMKAPGMKHTWAERIVRFRPYRTKQDLLDRGIVTAQVYDRIKDSLIAHRDKQ